MANNLVLKALQGVINEWSNRGYKIVKPSYIDRGSQVIIRATNKHGEALYGVITATAESMSEDETRKFMLIEHPSKANLVNVEHFKDASLYTYKGIGKDYVSLHDYVFDEKNEIPEGIALAITLKMYQFFRDYQDVYGVLPGQNDAKTFFINLNDYVISVTDQNEVDVKYIGTFQKDPDQALKQSYPLPDVCAMGITCFQHDNGQFKLHQFATPTLSIPHLLITILTQIKPGRSTYPCQEDRYEIVQEDTNISQETKDFLGKLIKSNPNMPFEEVKGLFEEFFGKKVDLSKFLKANISLHQEYLSYPSAQALLPGFNKSLMYLLLVREFEKESLLSGESLPIDRFNLILKEAGLSSYKPTSEINKAPLDPKLLILLSRQFDDQSLFNEDFLPMDMFKLIMSEAGLPSPSNFPRNLFEPQAPAIPKTIDVKDKFFGQTRQAPQTNKEPKQTEQVEEGMEELVRLIQKHGLEKIESLMNQYKENNQKNLNMANN
jgi:hypothetical protein